VSEQGTIRQHRERIGAGIGDRSEGVLQLLCSTNLHYGSHRHVQCPARHLNCFKVEGDARIGRIPQHGDAREPWHCLLEELHAFPFQLRSQNGKSRDVPARPREARDDPAPNWIDR
jgi:hypothetical protein